MNEALDERDAGTPEFLFVANFSPWHGLDTLLNEIEKSSINFKLHIVGTILPDDASRIQNLKDKRLVVHGVLNSEQIRELSQRCWVGFSTFAHHRAGMTQSSALKVREYLIFGLPVYSDSPDVFPDSFPFYKVGKTDIHEIVKYAFFVRDFTKKSISNASKKYVDKVYLLTALNTWISDDQKKKNLNILHSAALLRPPSGICNQMDWEQRAADELALNWRVKMYCPQGALEKSRISHFDDAVSFNATISPVQKLNAWIKLRKNYHQWLLAQQNDVDVFLLRYYVHDPYQWNFVRRCKKPVYFVHHTIEIPELALPGGLSGFVRSKLEWLVGGATLKKSAGLIGVTQEIVNYQISRSGLPKESTCVYPNGIFIQ
ncbi:MAG: hypothetical protein RR705_02180 [Lachnospiraceae bacterium]